MTKALGKTKKLNRQKLEFRAHQRRDAPPPYKQPRFPGKSQKGQHHRNKNTPEIE